MAKSGWISPIVMKNTDRNNILKRVRGSKSDSVCGNTGALNAINEWKFKKQLTEYRQRQRIVAGTTVYIIRNS
ncbi:hypothetical protein [Methylobacter luteus]|uniref:hypothetical protein n=1 Tax=Methylobacter luteus TaxID=415 RepID=UPI00041AB2A9|nr:hypothetical protein [Methylobacter luteus]